jgi:3-phosphoshikimate 1-carboxyvinyltransferase
LKFLKNMDYLIKAPLKISTTVHLPASKSISNRVLLIRALSAAPLEIRNLADCDDTNVMIGALQTLHSEIDIKAAGTAMRFLTAYFAGKQGQWTITGTERMRKRPIKILVDALNFLGAHIQYADREGFPPLRIDGCPLEGGEVWLDGGVSSQYISALLMAAPLMKNGLRLHLTGRIISRPYLQMTIRLMNEFGVTVEEEGNTFFVRKQSYLPVPYTVESDWSAASYWFGMVALSDDAEVILSGLFADSLQGDTKIVGLFDKLGVETIFTSTGVLLKRKERNIDIPFVYDFTDMPDMVQTFTVVSTMLNIPFCFSGLQSLKIKETDRLSALITEMSKLGFLLTECDGHILQWNGERTEYAASSVIHTYEDHRMAMAFAPVAIRNVDGIGIADCEVVSKSYPHFWDDLRKAGFQLTHLDKHVF